MITVTFIRHGQSEDNTKDIWAGWKDSPLSELGLQQARALGQYFSTTRFDVVYSSPLLRAFQTGTAVHNAQPAPQPPLVPNPKLREQHFGIAEGRPWIIQVPPDLTVEQCYAKDLYPIPIGRSNKFPEGESPDELAQRAEAAIAECVLPHLLQEAPDDVNIAITSHGLCISELISALLRLDPSAHQDRTFTGLMNTAWTRVNVSVKEGHPRPSSVSGLPPLNVHVTDINRKDHLDNLGKPVNEDSTGARAFFGGATEHTNPVVLGRNGELL